MTRTRWVLLALVLWAVLAYLVLPFFWRHWEHLPALQSMPKVTRAPDGLPGDPLNVGLIGTDEQVIRALAAAGWRPADPITLRSSIGIAASVVLNRPDLDAPVSNLLLFGRHQDLAWEQEVGGSARHRNHVRFWRTDARWNDDRPVWIGAATYDRGVGLSHTTGQVTHHIGPDIDAERDHLMRDLAAAGTLTEIFQVTGIGPTLDGHNGGGDRYFTDGEMWIGVLGTPPPGGPTRLANPPIVDVKDQLWTWMKPWLGSDVESAPVTLPNR